MGKFIASIANPFAGVKLFDVNAIGLAGIAVAAQMIADSIRIGGVKRALQHLSPGEGKLLIKSLDKSNSILPDPIALWLLWPETLKASGLGAPLGVSALLSSKVS